MRFGVRLSLVWKFLLAFVLVVLVGIGTVSLLANTAATREVGLFMARGGFTDSERASAMLSAYYQGKGSWEGVEDFFAGDHDAGHSMFGSGPWGPIGRILTSGMTLTDASGVVIASQNREVGADVSAEALSDATPIEASGETIGYLLPEETFSLGLEANLLERVRRGLVLAALAAGFVALVVGGLLIYNLLRPVSELTTAARALAKGELSRRVPVRSKDELGDLSDAFNQMATNLEHAETLRQEMTADIAHELRTPLAVIQAKLEAILDGVNPATSENLETVLEQSRLLNRLVGDLRTLALADAGQLPLEHTQVDLVALLQRVGKAHTNQALAKGIDLQLELEGGQERLAWIDPVRIEQVLANLLTNALRHARTEGRVVLSLRSCSDASKVCIEVADDGEGIPEEALENVFARFYRADKGRSRQAGGTGLGLAIARKLVEAHGGQIRARNGPQRGAIFSLELPLGPTRCGEG
ncbi:MAG TPA: HAMP domain-containing protein [Anaerolineae bacterium]|nr:HAMP domain-containing protein [Anaerolineae bacterium]